MTNKPWFANKVANDVEINAYLTSFALLLNNACQLIREWSLTRSLRWCYHSMFFIEHWVASIPEARWWWVFNERWHSSPNWWRQLQDALAIVLHTIARVSCNRHLMYSMICSEHHDLMFAIILVHRTTTIDTYHVNRNVPYDWHDVLQSFSAWHRRANLIFIGLLILLEILANQVFRSFDWISNSC